MLDQDKTAFAEIYRGVCATYGREVNKDAMRIAWGVLLPFDLQQVRQAYSAHVATGEFMPTPAHILNLITASHPAMARPGADEAWMKTPPEELSYWATDEMVGAWAVVAEEMHSDRPDRTAARMAFKDTYNRLVDEAKAQGRPVRWRLVRGTRKENLEDTVREGLRLGYLPPDEAQELLAIECESARPATLQPLIEGAIASGHEFALRKIADIKSLLADRPQDYDLDAIRAECEARDRAREQDDRQDAA